MINENIRRPGTNNTVTSLLRKVYAILTSARLALALMIIILGSCLIGVTFLRGDRSWTGIFSTLWFNGLLIVLVVNVGCCFFGRIWGRRVTTISLGMILFHLSFVAVFTGIVYNSLFYFRGAMRITEGETLDNADRRSYDSEDRGRYFNLSRLHGETTLIKMHAGYTVEGADKRVAYELAVGEGTRKKQGLIYITQNLDYNGFTYLPDREGYSILIILYDRLGRELYGAHVPLQSLRQKDGSYFYTTGTKEGPGYFEFPQAPEKPVMGLQVIYQPDPKQDRAGNVIFRVKLLDQLHAHPAGLAAREGKTAVGQTVTLGDYSLSAKEVHYWVSMNVHYEPGKPIVLTSLWVGLAGMIITTVGRIRRGGSERKSSKIAQH